MSHESFGNKDTTTVKLNLLKMRKTISTKNQIMDYLQWSSDDYDKRVFTAYWNWCQQYGGYPSVVQQLLANAKINRWFMMEYQKCEFRFLKIVGIVPINHTEQLRGHYKACTSQAMAVFPKPLIDGIKRNREFSSQLATNLPAYYAN